MKGLVKYKEGIKVKVMEKRREKSLLEGEVEEGKLKIKIGNQQPTDRQNHL